MFLQALCGLHLAIGAVALSIAATISGDEVRQQRFAAWVRRLVLAYAALALVLALQHWWLYPDWVHLLWTSVHPQLALFVGSGAFLMRDEWRRRAGAARFGRGPWIMLAVLLAFALLPAVLIQWVPDTNAEPRNLGRPIAGTLEVACFGLGGPLPPALVPENHAGVGRGMGFLPREITVPVGALATCAVLWIALCCIQLMGACLRPPRLRRGWFLLAPFAALELLWWPLPFGLDRGPVWSTDPTLMRAFGPLLLTAALASLFVPLGQWLALNNGARCSARAPRAELARIASARPRA